MADKRQRRVDDGRENTGKLERQPQLKRSKQDPKTATSGLARQLQGWKSDLSLWYGSLRFPPDLFDAWRLAIELSPTEPCAAFVPLGVTLVGPFEVLAGLFAGRTQVTDDEDDAESKTSVDIHMHHRYKWDVPEFMTVMVSAASPDQDKGRHWGYWRDDPAKMPSFVAENTASSSSVFKGVSDTLFGALCHVTKELDAKGESVLKRMKQFASNNGYVVEGQGALKRFRDRKRKIVASVFHGLGMVVPFSNDVGYRPLPCTAAQLKEYLSSMVQQKAAGEKVNYKKLDELMPLIAYANDEGDPGMALELGLNLFSFDELFSKRARKLLVVCYSLLDRDLYADIVKRHVSQRGRVSLSVL